MKTAQREPRSEHEHPAGDGLGCVGHRTDFSGIGHLGRGVYRSGRRREGDWRAGSGRGLWAVGHATDPVRGRRRGRRVHPGGRGRTGGQRSGPERGLPAMGQADDPVRRRPGREHRATDLDPRRSATAHRRAHGGVLGRQTVDRRHHATGNWTATSG